jgi:hypothetical protein
VLQYSLVAVKYVTLVTYNTFYKANKMLNKTVTQQLVTYAYTNAYANSNVLSATAGEDSGHIYINNKKYAKYCCSGALTTTRKNKTTVYACWDSLAAVILHKVKAKQNKQRFKTINN